jgi:8-oxo-dGTP pyrophosphatase MutT (NUDIX family)
MIDGVGINGGEPTATDIKAATAVVADAMRRYAASAAVKKRPPLSPRRYPGRAAVLIPLCVVDNKLSLLLCKRSNEIGTHRGQMAFAGGHLDAIDDGDDVAAAVRETREEIGVVVDAAVDVVGALAEVPSVTNVRCVTRVCNM